MAIATGKIRIVSDGKTINTAVYTENGEKSGYDKEKIY